jgi:hypothetical protein
MKLYPLFAAGLIGVALAAPAAGHVILSQPTAAPGSAYTAYFRVMHSCGGSPTTALRVEIPEDVLGVKPQPKAGWTLSIEHAPLAKPTAGMGGKMVTERVSAVIWTGGPLPDEEWDEFGLSARLPSRTGAVSFPATQTCAGVEERWTDVPSPGQAAPAHPAPRVMLTDSPAVDDGMAAMPMAH